MYQLTDNENNVLTVNPSLEGAIEQAWRKTNHLRDLTPEDMAHYVDNFNKRGFVEMSYGFYRISVEAR